MIPWVGRLRAQLTLVAPDGSQHTAAWQGNDIPAEKRVAQFDYPLVDGTQTQDLGAKGIPWPLTLYFEGDDHDTRAWAFLRALAQRGPWAVIHPVYGQLTLQPLGATLAADPTNSGNVSKVESSWIEAPAEEISASIAELAAQISAQVDAANTAASVQLQEASDLQDPEAAAAAATAGTRGLDRLKASKLGKLIQKATDLQATYARYHSLAQEAFSVIPMQLANAAGQVQAICQLPALTSEDVTTKISSFGDFADQLLSSLVPASDVNARNQAMIDELFLEGALSGACLSVATSTPQTREQAVQAIEDLRALFAAITAGLDAVQAASPANAAADQYFSHGATFAILARLVGLATAYLLRHIFDLKVAKRFTLTRPRAPIEITIKEYGDLGSNDSNYDLFIASNHLRGDEILLLPAGREVVVYV